jgi:hypothetical protein
MPVRVHKRPGQDSETIDGTPLRIPEEVRESQARSKIAREREEACQGRK